MTISMYQASIPVMIRALDNLAHILQAGAAHAETKKIDPSVLVNYRLYPDMLPLARQVQIASDGVKGGAARLAGVEAPKYEDNETTFAELAARVQKTVAYLETFKAEQIDGSEDKTITLQQRTKTVTFQGQAYLLTFVLPNLFFHVTTTYAILRHCGVEIGKQDYLGKVY